MKAFIATIAIVAAMALFAGSVLASGCSYGHGYGHGFVDYHYEPCGHWEYIPAQIVGHGCHAHVIPGRWVFVQDHYHLHYDLHY